ncbi:MAG: hypothetical protein GY821_03600 [Gammaproteobacteria bacterium]|nr:hypothetical protein [Gammaproteobacteria bacterium]
MVQNEKIESMDSFVNEGSNKAQCDAGDHFVSEQGFYKQGTKQTGHQEFDMKKVLDDGMADDITGKGNNGKIRDEFDKAQKEGDETNITIKFGGNHSN